MILFVYSLVSIYWTHSVSAARGFGSKYLQINKKKRIKCHNPELIFYSIHFLLQFDSVDAHLRLSTQFGCCLPCLISQRAHQCHSIRY